MFSEYENEIKKMDKMDIVVPLWQWSLKSREADKFVLIGHICSSAIELEETGGRFLSAVPEGEAHASK